jgi:hypothetical protein
VITLGIGICDHNNRRITLTGGHIQLAEYLKRDNKKWLITLSVWLPSGFLLLRDFGLATTWANFWPRHYSYLWFTGLVTKDVGI